MTEMARFGPARSIQIPVGSWIEVPLRPLQFEGNVKHSVIDIQGDHVIVRVPYFFLADHSRVDYHHYSLTRLRSIDE